MNLDDLKLKTEIVLLEQGIKVNPNLPTIEELDEVSARSAKDVASRACAIAYVVGMAFGADRSELIDNLKKYKLWDFVTPKEKRLLNASSISKEEKEACLWLPENAQVLAWSLGLVKLDHSISCDDDLATKIPFKVDPKDFIDTASLTTIDKIQEQSDLLYRMHSYAVHERLSGRDCPFNEGIVFERRKAIDWVYGVEYEWDDIPMDT